MSAERTPENEKTYSTTEAKNQLSSLIRLAEGEGQVSVIEAHGRPRAAVISYDELLNFKKLKEKERRQEAWRQAEALRKRVSARFADLTDEERAELIDRAVHEAFQELLESGRIDRHVMSPA